MTTTSTTNASQMIQFTTVASVSHGSPTLLCSMAMAGIVSSAATSNGNSRRRSMRSARSSTIQGSTASAAVLRSGQLEAGQFGQRLNRRAPRAVE